MENNPTNLEHPFSKTLGEGPYKVVGFMEIKPCQSRGTTVLGDVQLTKHDKWKGGCGTCSHCGMAIMNIVVIRTGSGELHGVGTSCALKADLPPKEVGAIQLRIRKQNRTKRAELNGKKRAAIAEAVKNKQAEISSIPHPYERYSKEGQTYLDYINRCCFNYQSVVSAVYKTLVEKNIIDKV